MCRTPSVVSSFGLGCIIAVFATFSACADGATGPGDSDLVGGPKADDPTAAAPYIGVMPDYAEVQAIGTHVLLRELAPSFEASLRTTLGDRFQAITLGFQGPVAGYSGDTSVVWARDFFPILVGTADGIEVVPYLSVGATRSGYTGSSWIPVAAPSPDHQWYRRPGATTGQWRRTKLLPLLHENGNLIAVGPWLIATDRLLRLNTEHSEGSTAGHLKAAGWKPRPADEVLDLLADATHTPRDHIIVLDPMPGEKTDHADLVVMALGPNEVMVPEIRTDILDLITYGHEIELGWRVREYLDDTAVLLEDLGLTVHRLPMLAPVFLIEDARELTGYNAVSYSPANSLQVHVSGELPQVWLPTFDPDGFPEAYVTLAQAYEDIWADFFEARGMKVHAVDATTLGKAYGLFHCVTAPEF